MTREKKKILPDKEKEPVDREVSERPKRQQKTAAEGSRYAALMLLIISIIVSLGFYLWGHATTFNVLELGEPTGYWEYTK